MQGSTRRKIAKASGCSFEYVGMLGIMTGDRDERARCWDYIRWLLKQQKGTLGTDISFKDRNDVTVFPCKSGFGGISRIYGTGGATLRLIEQNTGTFCFNIPDPDDEPEKELVLIFSHDKGARGRARDAMRDVLNGHRVSANGGNGGQQRCYDFSVGRCRRGNSCKWAHIVPPGPPGPSRGGDRGRGGPSRGGGPRRDDRKPYSRPNDTWGAMADRLG